MSPKPVEFARGYRRVVGVYWPDILGGRLAPQAVQFMDPDDLAKFSPEGSRCAPSVLTHRPEMSVSGRGNYIFAIFPVTSKPIRTCIFDQKLIGRT